MFRGIGALTPDSSYLYSPLTSADDLGKLMWAAPAVVLPVTLLLGAIFPLLGRLLTDRWDQVGRSVGRLYAWNTVGGVVGSLGTGYLLIPTLGVQGAFYLATLGSLAVGAVALLLQGRLGVPRYAAATLLAAVLLAGMSRASGDIFLEVVERRLIHFGGGPGEVLFHTEDTAASVTGYRVPDGRLVLLVNGIIVSGKGVPGAMMVHVPLLLRDAPRKALVVCFGVGTSFRAAVDHIGRVDAVELVEDVVRSFPIWEPEVADYPGRDDTRIHIADGRNYMLLAEERYDVIIVDAAPPIFSEGTVNLYSREFIALTRDRLTEQGIFMLWVPTPCFDRDFWSIARNFSEAFDHVGLWSLPDIAGVVLMGSAQPIDMDPDAVERRILERKLSQRVPWMTRQLFEDGLVMTEAQLREKAAGYPIITDDRPRTEYPLGAFLADEQFHYLPRFVPRPSVPLVPRTAIGDGYLESARVVAIPSQPVLARTVRRPEPFGVDDVAAEVQALFEAGTQAGVDFGLPYVRWLPPTQGEDGSPAYAIEVGLRASEESAGEGLQAGALPGGDAAVADFTGPPGDVAAARQALVDWAAAQGREPAGPLWETRLRTDPGAPPTTRLVLPVR